MSTYSTGAVSITNGSNALSGTGGMQWAGIARPGDLIAIGAAIGVVAAVNSNTSITLTRNWTGGTLSGAAYDLILVDAGNRDTVSLHELLVALGSGNIKALADLAGGENTLPYFTGAGVMELTGLTSQARTLLASTLLSRSGNNLVTVGAATRITGPAVTQSATDTTAGRLPTVGWQGLGAANPPAITNFTAELLPGFYRYIEATATGAPGAGLSFFGSAIVGRSSEGYVSILATRFSGANPRFWMGTRVALTGSVSWREIYTTGNTTIDSNGFIKAASPIARLYNDRTEEPVEAVDASMARLGVGRYTLSGVPPLAAAGWQIEVPQDHNGNRLVFVETAYDEQAETLTVTTSKPVWSMETMSWAAGDPVDIPDGRWVDLRFWKEPAQEEAPKEE